MTLSLFGTGSSARMSADRRYRYALRRSWGRGSMKGARRVRPDGTPRSWWARLVDVAYLDSEHERSARAQTALGPDGLTWSEREDGARR